VQRQVLHTNFEKDKRKKDNFASKEKETLQVLKKK